MNSLFIFLSGSFSWSQVSKSTPVDLKLQNKAFWKFPKMKNKRKRHIKVKISLKPILWRFPLKHNISSTIQWWWSLIIGTCLRKKQIKETQVLALENSFKQASKQFAYALSRLKRNKKGNRIRYVQPPGLSTEKPSRQKSNLCCPWEDMGSARQTKSKNKIPMARRDLYSNIQGQSFKLSVTLREILSLGMRAISSFWAKYEAS